MEAAERASKRLRETELRQRKRKRQKMLVEKREAETSRQRLIMGAIEKKRVRCRQIRSDVTVPTSPFSRHSSTSSNRGKCTKEKEEKNKKRSRVLLKPYAEENISKSGDPYGGMRKSIAKMRRRRRGGGGGGGKDGDDGDEHALSSFM